MTVPVLSSTTVSTRRVDSSTSGPLIRMPSWAPRPVPTISAVGVARPSAQGQAMISTATAAVNAAVGPPPAQQPAGEREQRQRDHDRHEDRRDPVGEPLDLGLAVLRLLDEARHLGQLGVGADPGGADDEPAAGVDGGADDRVAGADLDRHGLAGEHRGVDGRGAVLDDAVGGDLLAGPDDEPVADRELLDRHQPLDAVAQHADLLGAERQQRAQRGAGAPLGARLEPAPGQQERRDAGGRLEVDVAEPVGALDREPERVGHAGHPGGAEEQRDQGPGERREHAERDQRVHRGRAVARRWSRPRGGTASAPHTTTGAARVSDRPLPVA